MVSTSYSAAVLLLLTVSLSNTYAQDCEVCIGVITRFSEGLTSDQKSSPQKIETEFKKFCKGLKNRENRFCYYVGGAEDSATGILGEMSKPLSWGVPPQKICSDKLRKMDSQICDLMYEKQIDINTVDLKKLKVRDLKKILSDWDENCDDCLEKGDFVRYIEKVKPKHVKAEL